MRIVIGGASGFVGPALVEHLRSQGHVVTRLVRAGPAGDETSHWHPASGAVDTKVIEEADAVVNLGGASVLHWPWTTSYARKFEQSRVDCTTTLALAIAQSSTKPAFISASGMSHYGSDRGDEPLTEESTPGDGFLARVVHHWEAVAQPAREAGSRVCSIRTTNVLDAGGGTLSLLKPIFRLGLGGRVGSGRQYFSVVSLSDWVRAVAFITTNPQATGPYNLGSPQPATNEVFTEELARALRRKAMIPVPAAAVRLGAPAVAGDLLGSLRVEPRRLLDAGFNFDHRDMASVIAAALR